MQKDKEEEEERKEERGQRCVSVQGYSACIYLPTTSLFDQAPAAIDDDLQVAEYSTNTGRRISFVHVEQRKWLRPFVQA